MRIISESEMNFGKFDESKLFYIEASKVYKELGTGIKTVEFILKHNDDSIIFLEAKKTCPNVANRYESVDKEQKFEDYYKSITEKFISSLQVYLATVLKKDRDISEVGKDLQSADNIRDNEMKFVLVVKNAKNESWLAGPLAELKNRLLQVRKIWSVKVIVLNEELAKEYKLIC